LKQGTRRFTLPIVRLTVLAAVPAIAAASSPITVIARFPGVQINTAKVDASGNIYLGGQSTTSGSSGAAYVAKLGPGGAAQSSGATAFAARLDATGKILYSALIGGNAQTQPRSIVVNSKRELVVSGQLTTGDHPSAAPALLLLKLSADGAQVTAGPQGIGGLVAADAQDNIYVAGVPLIGTNGPPSTPGEFQGMPEPAYCGCPFLNFPWGGGQFVASLT
jgi:hypothetical protein